MNQTIGTLYIVATPIGNTEDMTKRALETLTSVNGIVAEDTRRAGLLLSKLKIDPRPKLFSLHAQSQPEKLDQLTALLKEGKSLAYITDAGTPGISDPGSRLARAAWEAGVRVVPVPGASAFIAALSAAGIATRSILFLGFLPKKKGHQTAMKSLVESEHTVVFFESTHRIEKTLAELDTLLPDREIATAKELTKTHERYLFGTPKGIIEQLATDPALKNGEWVVMIPPK